MFDLLPSYDTAARVRLQVSPVRSRSIPMSTEDAFQAALDAHPDDWHTRLVFADWLDELGDGRAEGYRALAERKLCPYFDPHDPLCWWTTIDSTCVPLKGLHGSGCTLPDDWLHAIEGLGADPRFRPCDREIRALSRRQAEDAAARAFATLPARRRAELRGQPPFRPGRS